MAITDSSLPAVRSPLRARLSGRQQPSISSAASAHLRHLHQVASWASLLVPPLGAFLGSRLASTSEILGYPPPSSHHFTCQRCESVLHVGINCSFRVKSKKLKKRGTITKGVSAPVNRFIYSCQHCAFESVISGTSKGYVKTKLSERAAHHKLSVPNQSLDACMTENVTKPFKVISNEILSSSASVTERPGSNSKRTKRKGWLSLKKLSASSVDFSPSGSRSVVSMKSVNPFFPQSKRLDSARVMPTVSQANIKCLIPTSDFVGELGIKTMPKWELSEGDTGSDKGMSCVPQLDVSNSLGVAATSLWSDAEVMIPISKKVGESISSEKPPVNTTDSLQQSNASGIAMIIEEKGWEQKLSIHHIYADAAMLKQLSLPASVSKCSGQDTISTIEAPCNLSYTVLQSDSTIVPSISSSQGLRTSEDVTFNSNSANLVEDAGLSLLVKSSIEHLDDQETNLPSSDKEVITNNSINVKAVWSKKRKHDNNSNWCNVPKKQEIYNLEADKLRLGGIKLSGVRKNINTQILACERKAKPRTKKKPLFRRVGRQWFTVCKFNRMLKWRII